jgi:hypothetical protein
LEQFLWLSSNLTTVTVTATLSSSLDASKRVTAITVMCHHLATTIIIIIITGISHHRDHSSTITTAAAAATTTP